MTRTVKYNNKKMEREIIISCIGISYVEPILHLYKELIAHNYSGESKIKASSRESGYSISIIVLSVLLVESAMNRIKYLERNKEENLKFFENKFREKNPNLYKKLIEIYILRDLIVHNHIWRISYVYDDNYDETKIYQKLLDGYGSKRGNKGDRKYNLYVNKKTKKTKFLSLNVNPIKIDTKDVKIVLGILKEFFEFFDGINLSYFAMKNNFFMFNGNFKKFSEIVNEIICS